MNVFNALPALLQRVDVRRGHLVHVGAHEGQEMPFYRAVGFSRITLVEPIPELAAKLRSSFPDVDVVECACSDRAGVRTLSVMKRTNMSTLLTPDSRDKTVRRIDVNVRRLDTIAPTATVAVIDAQGEELNVLKGAPLDTLDMVIVETCTVDDPTMASKYDDVVLLMSEHGFIEVESWTRDYGFVFKWARGARAPDSGEIRDVVFVRR